MLMVARDVYQLPLTPRSGVNAYLVGDVLVDSGYPLHTKKLLRETSSRTIHAHALTHAHADHAGGQHRVLLLHRHQADAGEHRAQRHQHHADGELAPPGAGASAR